MVKGLWASALVVLGSISAQADDVLPASIPVANFAALPNYRGVQLSPDGRHIAYRLTYKQKSVVLVHSIADNTDAIAIPPFNNAEIRWFDWATVDTLAVSFGVSGSRRYYNGQRLLRGSNIEETRFYAYRKDGSNVAKPVHLARPARDRSQGIPGRSVKSEPLFHDHVVHWLPDDSDHILLGIDADLAGGAEIRKVNENTGEFRVHVADQ